MLLTPLSSRPTVHRYRLSLLPTRERRYLIGTMYRVPVLCERWLVCADTLHDWLVAGDLPSVRICQRRLINGADALDFMDKRWPEFITGAEEPNYDGKQWQRLTLADRCAFLLQLRRPVDVATALGIGLTGVRQLAETGLLRSRIRNARKGMIARSPNSFATTAADVIHFLDHSSRTLSLPGVSPKRRHLNAVNSTS